MTLPTGEPNRPASQPFDFGLGGGSTQSTGETTGDATLLTRPRAEQRRLARVDTRSFTIPIVVIVLSVLVAGGAAFAGWTLVQQSEAAVKADSAAFCANLAETPGVLTQPGFGWPTDGGDLNTTLELMKAYEARWDEVAAVAPPTIKPDVKAVAQAAGIIIGNIETSKTIDRPGSLATMQTVATSTDIPAWAEKYC